jgi:uncharacterized ubiquitin-like protein YukD
MSNRIDIRLEWKKRQLDLQIPSGVTLSRLTDLIGQVFKGSKTSLPKEWNLQPKNKPIVIGKLDILDDFPIGNGDIFEIVTGETHESI